MLRKYRSNHCRHATVETPHRILENRIVFCVNCDCNRTLATNSSGQLVCPTCASESWMYVAAPLAAHFQNYNEGLAEAEAAGNSFARSCPVL